MSKVFRPWTGRETKLKERLDVLDTQLQALHAQVAARRVSPQRRKVRIDIQKTDENVKNIPPINLYTAVGKSHKTNTTVLTDSFCSRDDLKKYLQCISKSVSKGNEAVDHLASLTEVSSFPEGGEPADRTFRGNYKKELGIKQLTALCKETGPRRKKSTFVENKGIPQKYSQLKCDIFLREFEKLIKKLKIPMDEEDLLAPPTKEVSSSEPEKLEKTVEDKLEDLVTMSLLKDRLNAVKKKLRDERAKKETAEKAIAGYRRRLACYEGKGNGKPKADGKFENTSSPTEKNEEKAASIAVLEKELQYERNKRIEADKRIEELQHTLETNRIEISNLEDSKKWALSVAESLRDNACQHDLQALERLRARNHELEKEVVQLRDKAASGPTLVESILERADRAERELMEKMKECNELLARNSVNDPEVQKLLESHKTAYKKLEKDKNEKETEFKKQYRLLNEELEAVKLNSEKKYKKLNEEFKALTKEVQGKELALQNLITGRSTFETEITALKSRLMEAYQKNDNQQTTIKDLNEKLKINSQKLENLNADYEEKKKFLQSSVESKLRNYNTDISEKEQVIDRLREDVERQKDTITIKEKMLADQLDSIKCLRTVASNTKRALDEERTGRRRLEEQISRLQCSNEILQRKLSACQKRLNEELSFRSLQEKSTESLKEMETQISARQKTLEKQLAQMGYERDQAIQTARFATEKLVVAINDYETKLSIQNRFNGLLKIAYNEKEFELDVANKQLQELNEELWKSSKNAEAMKRELEASLWKACEVCASVIDEQMEKEFLE